MCYAFSAEVVDFTKPSGSHSTHPKLFHWVKTYFENAEQSKSSLNNHKIIPQQESSQSDTTIACTTTHCNGHLLDDDVPVTKRPKLEDKSKTQVTKMSGCYTHHVLMYCLSITCNYIAICSDL